MILPVAPLAASVVGLFTAGVFAVLPTGLLEQMVVDSGVAAVLSVAEPPLGFTARMLLTLVCGGAVTLIAWFALFLALGARTVVIARPADGAEAPPMLRRADAHPDAPARRPLRADRDLGTPFLDVRARPVHVDAERIALATAVSGRAPPVSLEAAAPRRQTFDPGERFETFALTPAVRAVPDAVPDPSQTIHALLDRLERVAQRAAPAPPPETIEDTLTALRRMATRAG